MSLRPFWMFRYESSVPGATTRRGSAVVRNPSRSSSPQHIAGPQVPHILGSASIAASTSPRAAGAAHTNYDDYTQPSSRSLITNHDLGCYSPSSVSSPPPTRSIKGKLTCRSPAAPLATSPSREVTLIDDRAQPDPRKRRPSDLKDLVVRVSDRRPPHESPHRTLSRSVESSAAIIREPQDPRLAAKREEQNSSGDERNEVDLRPNKRTRFMDPSYDKPLVLKRIIDVTDPNHSRESTPNFRRPYDARKFTEVSKYKREDVRSPQLDPRHRKAQSSESDDVLNWRPRDTPTNTVNNNNCDSLDYMSESSPPGTPVRDERDESGSVYQHSSSQDPQQQYGACSLASRDRMAPMCLPLPRFALQLRSTCQVSPRALSSSPAGSGLLRSPISSSSSSSESSVSTATGLGLAATTTRIGAATTTLTIDTSMAHLDENALLLLADTPVSPGPQAPPSDSEECSSASKKDAELEERIKALDEKYEKWTGTARNNYPQDNLSDKQALNTGSTRKFLLDLNELRSQPSDIFKSVLSRRSIFDEDCERLENIEQKYEPKVFVSSNKNRATSTVTSVLASSVNFISGGNKSTAISAKNTSTVASLTTTTGTSSTTNKPVFSPSNTIATSTKVSASSKSFTFSSSPTCSTTVASKLVESVSSMTSSATVASGGSTAKSNVGVTHVRSSAVSPAISLSSPSTTPPVSIADIIAATTPPIPSATPINALPGFRPNMQATSTIAQSSSASTTATLSPTTPYSHTKINISSRPRDSSPRSNVSEVISRAATAGISDSMFSPMGSSPALSPDCTTPSSPATIPTTGATMDILASPGSIRSRSSQSPASTGSSTPVRKNSGSPHRSKNDTRQSVSDSRNTTESSSDNSVVIVAETINLSSDSKCESTSSGSSASESMSDNSMNSVLNITPVLLSDTKKNSASSYSDVCLNQKSDGSVQSINDKDLSRKQNIDEDSQVKKSSSDFAGDQRNTKEKKLDPSHSENSRHYISKFIDVTPEHNHKFKSSVVENDSEPGASSTFRKESSSGKLRDKQSLHSKSDQKDGHKNIFLHESWSITAKNENESISVVKKRRHSCLDDSSDESKHGRIDRESQLKQSKPPKSGHQEQHKKIRMLSGDKPVPVGQKKCLPDLSDNDDIKETKDNRKMKADGERLDKINQELTTPVNLDVGVRLHNKIRGDERLDDRRDDRKQEKEKKEKKKEKLDHERIHDIPPKERERTPSGKSNDGRSEKTHRKVDAVRESRIDSHCEESTSVKQEVMSNRKEIETKLDDTRRERKSSSDSRKSDFKAVKSEAEASVHAKDLPRKDQSKHCNEKPDEKEIRLEKEVISSVPVKIEQPHAKRNIKAVENLIDIRVLKKEPKREERIKADEKKKYTDEFKLKDERKEKHRDRKDKSKIKDKQKLLPSMEKENEKEKVRDKVSKSKFGGQAIGKRSEKCAKDKSTLKYSSSLKVEKKARKDSQPFKTKRERNESCSSSVLDEVQSPITLEDSTFTVHNSSSFIECASDTDIPDNIKLEDCTPSRKQSFDIDDVKDSGRRKFDADKCERVDPEHRIKVDPDTKLNKPANTKEYFNAKLKAEDHDYNMQDVTHENSLNNLTIKTSRSTDTVTASDEEVIIGGKRKQRSQSTGSGSKKSNSKQHLHHNKDHTAPVSSTISDSDTANHSSSSSSSDDDDTPKNISLFEDPVIDTCFDMYDKVKARHLKQEQKREDERLKEEAKQKMLQQYRQKQLNKKKKAAIAASSHAAADSDSDANEELVNNKRSLTRMVASSSDEDESLLAHVSTDDSEHDSMQGSHRQVEKVRRKHASSHRHKQAKENKIARQPKGLIVSDISSDDEATLKSEDISDYDIPPKRKSNSGKSSSNKRELLNNTKPPRPALSVTQTKVLVPDKERSRKIHAPLKADAIYNTDDSDVPVIEVIKPGKSKYSSENVGVNHASSLPQQWDQRPEPHAVPTGKERNRHGGRMEAIFGLMSDDSDSSVVSSSPSKSPRTNFIRVNTPKRKLSVSSSSAYQSPHTTTINSFTDSDEEIKSEMVKFLANDSEDLDDSPKIINEVMSENSKNVHRKKSVASSNDNAIEDVRPASDSGKGSSGAGSSSSSSSSSSSTGSAPDEQLLYPPNHPAVAVKEEKENLSQETNTRNECFNFSEDDLIIDSDHKEHIRKDKKKKKKHKDRDGTRTRHRNKDRNKFTPTTNLGDSPTVHDHIADVSLIEDNSPINVLLANHSNSSQFVQHVNVSTPTAKSYSNTSNQSLSSSDDHKQLSNLPVSSNSPSHTSNPTFSSPTSVRRHSCSHPSRGSPLCEDVREVALDMPLIKADSEDEIIITNGDVDDRDVTVTPSTESDICVPNSIQEVVDPSQHFQDKDTTNPAADHQKSTTAPGIVSADSNSSTVVSKASRAVISQEETLNAVAGLLASYDVYGEEPRSSSQEDELLASEHNSVDEDSDEAQKAAQMLQSEMPEVDREPDNRENNWNSRNPAPIPDISVSPQQQSIESCEVIPSSSSELSNEASLEMDKPMLHKPINIDSNSSDTSPIPDQEENDIIVTNEISQLNKIQSESRDKVSVPESIHFPDSPTSVQSEPTLQIDEDHLEIAEDTAMTTNEAISLAHSEKVVIIPGNESQPTPPQTPWEEEKITNLQEPSTGKHKDGCDEANVSKTSVNSTDVETTNTEEPVPDKSLQKILIQRDELVSNINKVATQEPTSVKKASHSLPKSEVTSDKIHMELEGVGKSMPTLAMSANEKTFSPFPDEVSKDEYQKHKKSNDPRNLVHGFASDMKKSEKESDESMFQEEVKVENLVKSEENQPLMKDEPPILSALAGPVDFDLDAKSVPQKLLIARLIENSNSLPIICAKPSADKLDNIADKQPTADFVASSFTKSEEIQPKQEEMLQSADVEDVKEVSFSGSINDSYQHDTTTDEASLDASLNNETDGIDQLDKQDDSVDIGSFDDTSILLSPRGRGRGGRGKRGRGRSSTSAQQDMSSDDASSDVIKNKQNRGRSKPTRDDSLTLTVDSKSNSLPEPRRSSRPKIARRHPDMVDHDETSGRRRRGVRRTRGSLRPPVPTLDVFDFHESDDDMGLGGIGKGKKDCSNNQSPSKEKDNTDDESRIAANVRKSRRLQEKVVDDEDSSATEADPTTVTLTSQLPLTAATSPPQLVVPPLTISTTSIRGKVVRGCETILQRRTVRGGKATVISMHTSTPACVASPTIIKDNPNKNTEASTVNENSSQSQVDLYIPPSGAVNINNTNKNLTSPITPITPISSLPTICEMKSSTPTSLSIIRVMPQHPSQVASTLPGSPLLTPVQSVPTLTINTNTTITHLKPAIQTETELSPTPLVDPVTGHLTPMTMVKEGQYIPVSGELSSSTPVTYISLKRSIPTDHAPVVGVPSNMMPHNQLLTPQPVSNNITKPLAIGTTQVVTTVKHMLPSNPGTTAIGAHTTQANATAVVLPTHALKATSLIGGHQLPGGKQSVYISTNATKMTPGATALVVNPVSRASLMVPQTARTAGLVMSQPTAAPIIVNQMNRPGLMVSHTSRMGQVSAAAMSANHAALMSRPGLVVTPTPRAGASLLVRTSDSTHTTNVSNQSQLFAGPGVRAPSNVLTNRPELIISPSVRQATSGQVSRSVNTNHLVPGSQTTIVQLTQGGHPAKVVTSGALKPGQTYVTGGIHRTMGQTMTLNPSITVTSVASSRLQQQNVLHHHHQQQQQSIGTPISIPAGMRRKDISVEVVRPLSQQHHQLQMQQIQQQHGVVRHLAPIVSAGGGPMLTHHKVAVGIASPGSRRVAPSVGTNYQPVTQHPLHLSSPRAHQPSPQPPHHQTVVQQHISPHPPHQPSPQPAHSLHQPSPQPSPHMLHQPSPQASPHPPHQASPQPLLHRASPQPHQSALSLVSQPQQLVSLGPQQLVSSTSQLVSSTGQLVPSTSQLVSSTGQLLSSPGQLVVSGGMLASRSSHPVECMTVSSGRASHAQQPLALTSTNAPAPPPPPAHHYRGADTSDPSTAHLSPYDMVSINELTTNI